MFVFRFLLKNIAIKFLPFELVYIFAADSKVTRH